MRKGLDRLVRRFNGYIPLRKDRHLMSHSLDMNDAEFRLFELYQDCYDFDEKHLIEYGTISYPDRDVAKILNWSPSKVNRTKNSLLKRKLLLEVSRGIYAVNPIFQHKSKLADISQVFADMKHKNSSGEQFVSPLQQKRTQNDYKSLVSYKDNLVSSQGDDEDTDIPF